MKFGKYLKENRINEWSKGYINYRLLKDDIECAVIEVVDMMTRLDEESAGPASRQSSIAGGSGPSAVLSLADSKLAGSASVLAEGLPAAPQTSGRVRAGPSTARVDQPREIPISEWLPEYRHSMTFHELRDILPPSCRHFMQSLESELEKVSAFYGEREAYVVEKFAQLSVQWNELHAHRQALKAQKNRPRLFLWTLRLSRRTDGEKLLSKKHTTDFLRARSRLRDATFEFYRKLSLLKSFRLMNHTGFTKAAKKFEKGTSIGCSARAADLLATANFVRSPVLEDVMRRTEESFAVCFTQGNRRQALRLLRELEDRQLRKSLVSWRAGFFAGAAVPLVVAAVAHTLSVSRKDRIVYWQGLLVSFGVTLAPLVFVLLFYLDQAAWRYGSINYPLVFELDVRTTLHRQQFLEIPSFYLLALAFFAWAAFETWPGTVAPSVYPGAFIILLIGTVLAPVPAFYSHTRWWFVRSFARVFAAGVIPVQFRDFFLGDVCISMGYSLANLSFVGCAYRKGWPDDVLGVCATSRDWLAPVLAGLPVLCRIGHCVRRFIDSDGDTHHAVNGVKFTTNLAFVFLFHGWRRDPTSVPLRVLMIIVGLANTVYSYAWDVKMDWSLFQTGGAYPLLRKDLGFKQMVWAYYAALVFNLLARLGWVTQLVVPARHTVGLTFGLALLEATRRAVWAVFRVESEHLGNVDGYRVTRNIPLPYAVEPEPSRSGANADDQADDPGPDGSFLEEVLDEGRRVRAALAKNFEPLVARIRPGGPVPSKRIPSGVSTSATKIRRKRSVATLHESEPDDDDSGRTGGGGAADL